jgi:hypothetical protein
VAAWTTEPLGQYDAGVATRRRSTPKRLTIPPAVLEVIRRLGAAGGKQRAKNMTASERVQNATTAAKARWKGVSAAERRAHAQMAVAARWAKRRKATSPD